MAGLEPISGKITGITDRRRFNGFEIAEVTAEFVVNGQKSVLTKMMGVTNANIGDTVQAMLSKRGMGEFRLMKSNAPTPKGR